MEKRDFLKLVLRMQKDNHSYSDEAFNTMVLEALENKTYRVDFDKDKDGNLTIPRQHEGYYWTRVKRHSENASKKARRRIKKGQEIPLESVTGVKGVDASTLELQVMMERALASLTEEERYLVERVVLGNEDVWEAAQDKGISKATAYREFTAVLQKLRTFLYEYAPKLAKTKAKKT